MDGETFGTDVDDLYNYFQYTFADNTLQITATKSSVPMTTPLNTVKVYGFLQIQPSIVNVDGTALDSTQVSYDDTLKVLTLSDLNLTLPANHEIAIN